MSLSEHVLIEIEAYGRHLGLGLNNSQLASKLGYPQASVRRATKELYEAGRITKKYIGGVYVFYPNKEQ